MQILPRKLLVLTILDLLSSFFLKPVIINFNIYPNKFRIVTLNSFSKLMDQSQNLYSKIFNISKRNFDEVALEIFKYQSKNNLIYKKYLKLLGVKVKSVKHTREIPFMPIDFFRDFKVISGNWEPETTFLSSGTSGQQRSKHHIRNLLFYKNVSLRIFNQYYGDPKQYHIFALLPSYNNVLQNSSLIHMAKFLIDASGSDLSGFYFDDLENLEENIQFAKSWWSKVDREFYVMQGEFYTHGGLGEKGFQPFSAEKMMRETPDYIVLNGRVRALSGTRALKAKQGETIRIFIGNAGVSKISSFHIIGEIMDRVYPEASLGHFHTGVQTTLIPAGGAAVVELKLENAGTFILLDHAISRIDRGAYGLLEVEGTGIPDLLAPLSAP